MKVESTDLAITTWLKTILLKAFGNRRDVFKTGLKEAGCIEANLQDGELEQRPVSGTHSRWMLLCEG